MDTRDRVLVKGSGGEPTGNWNGTLNPVYTIQSIVKPVVQPVWQPCWTNSQCSVVKPGCTTGLTTGCIHDTAVLSNRLSNGFDNRLNVCLHDTAGLQPVVKPVVQLDWQPVVSCKRGFRVLLTSVTYTVCLSLIIVIIIIMIATDKRDTALADQINSMIRCKTAKSLLNSGVIKFRQYKCFKFLKFFF